MLASWACKSLGPVGWPRGEATVGILFTLRTPVVVGCGTRAKTSLAVEGNDTPLAAVPLGPDVLFRSYVCVPSNHVLSHVPTLRATLNACIHCGLRNGEETNDCCSVPVPDEWESAQVCGIPNHYLIRGF